MFRYFCGVAARLPLPFFSDIATSALAKWPTKFNASKMAVVNDPILGAGRKVVQMTIHEADGGGGASLDNPRGQLQAPNNIIAGDDFWIGFGLLLPSGYPTPTISNGWNAFMQLYGAPFGGYPPFRIAFESNAGFFGWRREGTTDTCPITPQYDAWMDFAIHFKMSTDPAVGFVEVWTNFGAGWTQRTMIAAPGETLVGKRLYCQTITPAITSGPCRTDVQNYRKAAMFDVSTCYHADHRQAVSTGVDATDIAAVSPMSYGV